MKSLKNHFYPAIFSAVFLSAFSLSAAQKGSIFLGADIGVNVADNSPSNTISTQGGIVGEYFFAKQWSVVGKIKYSQSDADYYYPGYTSTFSGMGFGLFDEPSKNLSYEAKNIVVPINLKWNFRIFRDFYGSINAGPFANFTLNSKWTAQNVDFHDRKVTIGFNSGLGLHYQLKNGGQIFANYDFYRGASYGKISSFVFDTDARSGNHHASLGYQFLLKH